MYKPNHLVVGKDPLPVYWSLSNDLQTITRTGIITRILTLRLDRDPYKDTPTEDT